MSLFSYAVERALALVDRAAPGRPAPFDPATPTRPPEGRRRNWAHYGVKLPGLPDPHRAFNVMAILGTPGVELFANDELVVTTPADTAYVVSATSAMSGDQFTTYRMRADCDFAPDGSDLRFGDDLRIEGRWPDFRVMRTHPQVRVDLTLRATDKVARFFDIPGVYEHWSLLCRATGRITQGETVTEVDSLCTFEYATGMGAHSLADRALPPWVRLPARLFTYQVINVDERTQLLFVHVVGPGGVRLRSAVYERSLDSFGNVLTFGHVFAVHEHDREPLLTPDGRAMSMPRRFSWRIADDHRHEAARLDGTAKGDWVYGLGAGFCGTFDYEGIYRGRDITGTGYIEFIDLTGWMPPARR